MIGIASASKTSLLTELGAESVIDRNSDDLEAELIVLKVVEAPVSEGDELGQLVLTLYGDEVLRAPLRALSSAGEAGVFSRFSDWMSLFFANLFGS